MKTIGNKVVDRILDGFSHGSKGTKTALACTGPLWAPPLLVLAIVETACGVGMGVAQAIERVGGKAGDTAFNKVDKAEKIKAGLPSMGVDVQFRPGEGPNDRDQPDVDN